MKKIIINADDYGLSNEFNRGIVDLIAEGLVKSVTVMINKKHIFPKELVQFPNLSIGLHLEIDDLGSKNSFETQIKKFKSVFKMLPSHLDGHQHCHLKRENRQSVIRLALKYNLPVRSRYSKGRKDLQLNNIKTPDRFIAWQPDKKEDFFNRISLIEEKATEIVCHPGYFDKKHCWKLKYNQQREEEFKILKTLDFKKILTRFKLINYKEL